jgi:putative NADH-flavin reductase
MKIAVLGGTGPSGIQVVKEALERGHNVTAIVRNPDKLTEKHDRLKVSAITWFLFTFSCIDQLT